jgi:SAM-dependent methyltransferase
MSSADPLLAEVAAAYAGVEAAESFHSRDDVLRYRAALIERSAEQAAFVAARGSGRILEVGCGNGRLLIELARRGAARAGVGVDVAASRIAFAREWAQDEGLEALRFIDDDLLSTPLEPATADVAICITGALGYFGAADPPRDDEVLQRLGDALVDGGLLVLELYPHPEERRLLEVAGGAIRLWRELPEDDPWRYYLSDLRLDGERAVLDHRKTFVHRTTGEIDTGRSERLRLYDAPSLSALLGAAGFDRVELHGGWDGGPYADGADATLVATARRRSRDAAS